MKILFASLPADGHFNPLTGIASHLDEQGHDVRWYAGPEYATKVDRLGMAHFPYREATEVTGTNLNDLFPERAGLKGPKQISFDLEKFFVSQVGAHFADMAAIRDEFAYDILFCDGAVYAAHLVAEVLDVPVLAVALASIMPDDEGPPPFFGLRPARTPVGRIGHRVVRHLLARTTKAGTVRYNEVLAEHGVAPIPLDGFPHAPLASARRVFLNGSPGLEFPGYRPLPNAEFVGALAPARRVLASDSTQLPPRVTDGGRKVVVVSQGTVDNSDPGRLIGPTLAALAGSGHVVVATTGGVRTRELRDRYGSDDAVIEDFFDFDALFRHADVFVTSGGFGSTLAAVGHGVPLVCAGKREGKSDLNARAGYNGYGIDLRTEHPKPAAVRAAVEKVLADPSYPRRAAALQVELESYDPMGRIDAVLAGVVAAAR